jgi:CheY-like chemotaxis protein
MHGANINSEGKMVPATLLHVENDPNDAFLFRHACMKAGMKVNHRVVINGAEALTYLSAAGEQAKDCPIPTLIVLDLNLPLVSGFDVLAWLRNEQRLRRLPVVVLTSSKQPNDVKRAYDLGANSYLVKPVELEALITLAKGIEQYWLSLCRLPSHG